MSTTDTSEKGLETLIVESLVNEAGYVHGANDDYSREHVVDAWIDESATKLGYEISFTRNFYKPPRMRPLDEIKADLFALQEEGEGLLEQIVGGRPA